jgi:hypothetical protein
LVWRRAVITKLFTFLSFSSCTEMRFKTWSQMQRFLSFRIHYFLFIPLSTLSILDFSKTSLPFEGRKKFKGTFLSSAPRRFPGLARLPSG